MTKQNLNSNKTNYRHGKKIYTIHIWSEYVDTKNGKAAVNSSNRDNK